MSLEKIGVDQVIRVIQEADPQVSDDDACAIAAKLDRSGSFAEWLHPDGRVNLVVTEADSRYVGESVRSIIPSGNAAKVQSAILELLKPSPIPAQGSGPISEAETSPQVQEASAVALVFHLTAIANSPLLDPALRADIQAVVGDMPLFKNWEDGELKTLGEKLSAQGTWITGCRQRVESGLLTQEDLKQLRDSAASLKTYRRLLADMPSVRTVRVTYSPEALQGMAQWGVKIRQSASSLQSNGVALSQMGSKTPNPALRSAALLAGAAAVVAGAVLGLASYLNHTEAEAAQPSPPVADRLPPHAPPTTSPLHEKTPEAQGVPVTSLELVGVETKDLPLVTPPRSRARSRF